MALEFFTAMRSARTLDFRRKITKIITDDTREKRRPELLVSGDDTCKVGYYLAELLS